MPSCHTKLDDLYAGTLQALENDGALTGIYKAAVTAPMLLSRNGLDGDHQADRKHHGGPERALNHYPAEHYDHWRALFPKRADAFVPGMFGENLSTHGLTEENVCVGDIFRLGEARIQVSQPRAPCWKLSRKLGLPDLAKRVAETGFSGWLYRVLAPGRVAAGDDMILENRNPEAASLAELWALRNARSPDLSRLRIYAQIDELAAPWRKAFASRLDYLAKQAT